MTGDGSAHISKNNQNQHKDRFKFIVNDKSILGPQWLSLYQTDGKVTFAKSHFEQAMMNVIREPNINSTVILRADILKEINHAAEAGSEPKFDESVLKKFEIDNGNESGEEDVKKINIEDLNIRSFETSESLKLSPVHEFVRRIIPRNFYKDAIINQTCLILNSKDPNFQETSLIVYTPHINSEKDCPFYIPRTQSVGILLHQSVLSVHYIPFPEDKTAFTDESERVVRTAYRLLQTANKHSKGVMQGYEKRVNHDQVVNKVNFQNTYIVLKKKYSKFLVENWAESTDPKKHVFEDIAIAAFLIELWIKVYGPDFRSKMQFRDLGCGNGALCYILLSESIKGLGIDARKRKSWSIYPPEVQSSLKEQVIIPSILLRPHPALKRQVPHLEHNGRFFPVKVTHEVIAPATVVYSSEDLLKSPQVNTAEFPPDTFIIGNHSDELTCWIPLLGHPYMVIPCCSHNFSGQRVRFNVRKRSPRSNEIKNQNNSKSTYSGLVDHVEYISSRVGWKVEKEMLRIPSTRNAAIIGVENATLKHFPTQAVYDMIWEDGGAEGWIQNTMSLLKRNPRNH
ncbi:tRNA (uracil) methyltransferase [Saccharomyces cerevisiae]|nr:Trm44p [Saccharomyces cerevisiae YJM1574]AJV97944.1 Trm44p [Saccharomyces cerevisiae YJM270]PTN29063.1 tRNA (uracil) methyltransferase [Saccharomyces cerevisiae]CAI4822477.1 CAS_1a_G0055220.mRNA.1.CDS.1 [Saccharomyces cerevisiae]CAI4847595.1 AFI_G0055200.mRNA.1.CDS.1 [Saccharomyces cerevisiae]